MNLLLQIRYESAVGGCSGQYPGTAASHGSEQRQDGGFRREHSATIEETVKRFCTEGPVKPDIHYALPAADRLDKAEIQALIDAQRYFILHAPRQTGKTSALLDLMHLLNDGGRYKALYINIEGAQANRDDAAGAMRTILSVLASESKAILKDRFADENFDSIYARGGGTDALRLMLSEWAAQSDKPIVLMIDEIDALVGDTLISVLRQLRAGYTLRPARFPQSVILCGVRDIQDYRIHGTKEIITGGSAFNVKAESLRLGDFTPADVRRLYGQHTAETGQVFEESTYDLVWTYTRGQPWLVNALADQACFRLQKDRTQPITPALIEQAKENLILKRVTHLDQLTDKLKERRVQSVIEPIVAGDDDTALELVDSDHVRYVIDLGLIRRGPNGLEISNGIYQEVIPRELNHLMQDSFLTRERTAWYVLPDGRLDMGKMLTNFQQFYRENSEIWLARFEYKEAGPQLILQAFLQRIINGGGSLDREYALGRHRTDLLVKWTHPSGVQRVVIETKVLRKSMEATLNSGLEQIAAYMDKTGCDDAHLVLFDPRRDVSWDAKVYRRDARTPGGKPVTVWGM
ncbi:MAG: AAA-like domain-containing protein [Bryobacteraceae bacterium]